MQVASLSMDPISSMPIVILCAPPEVAQGATMRLSISIGLVEASAIASELEDVRLERPMTHDLMRNLLVQSGVSVRAVDICDLRDGVYYACITLERDGVETRVDSRPSDAIALALRVRAPVRVARRLLESTAETSRRRRKVASGSQVLDPVTMPVAAEAADLAEGEGGPPFEVEDLGAQAAAPGDSEADSDPDPSDLEELSRISAELLASLSDEDFGKWKM